MIQTSNSEPSRPVKATLKVIYSSPSARSLSRRHTVRRRRFSNFIVVLPLFELAHEGLCRPRYSNLLRYPYRYLLQYKDLICQRLMVAYTIDKLNIYSGRFSTLDFWLLGRPQPYNSTYEVVVSSLYAFSWRLTRLILAVTKICECFFC
jgi:hypothetical protein